MVVWLTLAILALMLLVTGWSAYVAWFQPDRYQESYAFRLFSRRRTSVIASRIINTLGFMFLLIVLVISAVRLW